MRTILAVFALTTIFVACKTEPKEVTTTSEESTKSQSSLINNQMLETAIIYEANIRQYSNEGTFEAFTKDIPQLKELGVKII